MGKLYNLARMTTATTGTGTITLGSAVDGFLTFSEAGAVSGQTVTYAIRDGSHSEIGSGVYTASGTTLTRETIYRSTNSNSQISLTGSAVVIITPAAEDFRERLFANRTYYVRTDGSDSNTGLSNTSSGAFLTIQAAYNAFTRIDCNGYSPIIQVGAGSHTTGLNATTPLVGARTLYLIGDETTPGNVEIFVTNGHCILNQCRDLEIDVKGFYLRTATAGNCLWAYKGSTINVSGKIIFGATANDHVLSTDGSLIIIAADYEVIGGAVNHWHNYSYAMIYCQYRTITISWGPTFTRWAGSAAAIMIVEGNTFVGSITGARYLVPKGGLIDTSGSGSTYLPGSSAGSEATYGQYL